jgi:Flp pilus assembly protein TadG
MECMMFSMIDLWHSFRRDQRGVSAIEAAIALPVLALALCGTLEFGLNVYNRQQLQAAVQAGIQYALYYPQDTAGVQSAISNALPSSANAEVAAPTFVCECTNGTSIACNPMGTCSTGSPRKIMVVQVTRAPVMLVSYLIGLRPSTLKATGSIAVPAS